MTSNLCMPKGPGEQIERQNQHCQIAENDDVDVAPATEKRRWFVDDWANFGVWHA